MPGLRGIAAVLSLATALAGCSGSPAPAPPAATAERLPRSPSDFALDITVLPGRKLDALVGDDAPGGVEMVRSKYLVLADGSLRAEAGGGVKYLTRPGRVRILTMEEIADLWERLDRGGFSGNRPDLFLGNPGLLGPRPDEVLTIVTVTSDGFTRSILDRHTPAAGASDATPPGPVGELVRHVAGLAWFGGDAPGAIAIEPVRVDFGPNPYAVFLPPQPGREPPMRATPAEPALGPDTAVLGERPLPTPIEAPPPAGTPK